MKYLLKTVFFFLFYGIIKKNGNLYGKIMKKKEITTKPFSGFYELEADKSWHFYVNKQTQIDCKIHFHNSKEMIFVRKGIIKVRVNKTFYSLNEGDILFVDTMDVHEYKSIIDCDDIVIVTHVDFWDKFSKLFYGTFANYLPSKGKESTEIVDFVYENYEKLLENDNLFRYGFIQILLSKLVKVYGLTSHVKSSSENSVREILTYINANFSSDISIESIAKVFGYSKNYLSKIFNEYVGVPFRDYLNLVRIKNVYKTLNSNENKEKLTTVAFNSGFESMNTFYRAKKKFDEQDLDFS